MKRIVQVCCFLLLAAGGSMAQNNEVSFSIGPVFTTDQKLRVDTGLPGCQVQGCTAVDTFHGGTSVAFALGYARRIAGAGPVAIHVELSALRQPDHDVTVTTDNRSIGLSATGKAAATFITPSVRVQFLPKGRVSPWITGGYGYAHLSGDFITTSHTKGAAEFGGGIDVRMLPHLALRGEVRDFWTGGTLKSQALFTLTGGTALTSHIQHIFAGAGVVLKF
jgi:outer membrane protein with beta-barrel domain